MPWCSNRFMYFGFKVVLGECEARLQKFPLAGFIFFLLFLYKVQLRRVVLCLLGLCLDFKG